jgi:ferric-dicitrate binding protein FerR (iron transport regulator)
MNKQTKNKLIAFFKGHSKSNQAKSYLIDHQDDDSLNDFLVDEWEQTSAENTLQVNEGENWKKINQHLINSRPKKVFPIQNRWFVGGSIAVMVTLVIMFIAVEFDVLKFDEILSSQTEITYVIKQTNKGEKLNVTLPDGSNIRLNSSSKLRIPSNYSTASNRVVELEGEAFFNVSKVKNKSFKVISKGITTEVLGTKFNIQSLNEGKEVTVAVVSGKVRVGTARSEIILDPEEITKVSAKSINLQKTKFDHDEVVGWYKNILVFDQMSFDQVVKDLEQWYGVEFIIEGKSKNNAKYSGKFEDKSLQADLEGLGFSSSFEFEIKQKTVFIKF